MKPTLKVMSFNIRYGTADDGPNHWENRKHLALERIQAFEPDLLGLQECRDDTQAEFVRAYLPEYYFYGRCRQEGTDAGLEMTPILFKQAAFELLDSGHFWLSDTPEIVGSQSWGSAFPRIVTWVKLLHRSSGHLLTFVNTHFDYQPSAILASAHFLSGWLGRVQETSPIILTGDFNASKTSQAFRLLTQGSGLQDAHRQANPNQPDVGTFHGFGTSSQKLAIDWILTSSHLKAIEASVDTAYMENLYPSDHYPVGAVLEWQT